MKTTRFLLAVLAVAPFLAAPVVAAPAADMRPASVKTADQFASAPAIDARAVAIFDRSIRAYAQRYWVSQKFDFVTTQNSKKTVGSGSWQFLRPNRERVELLVNDKASLLINDGAYQFWKNGDKKIEKTRVETDALGEGVELLPAAGDVLGMMMQGVNPLTMEIGGEWRSATVKSNGSQGDLVVLTAQATPDEPVETYLFTFDPLTHLMTRAELSVVLPARGDEPEIKIAQAVDFAPQFAAPAPAQFRFQVPEGAAFADPNYNQNLRIGALPLAMNGPTLDGREVSLDDYKGKVVLLDFWATWCPPCLAELPTLKATYGKYQAQGFEIVGISLDDEDADLSKFVQARDLNWTHVYDKKEFNGPNADNYGVRAIPFTVLVGKDGKIAAINARGWRLPRAVKAALAQ